MSFDSPPESAGPDEFGCAPHARAPRAGARATAVRRALRACAVVMATATLAARLIACSGQVEQTGAGDGGHDVSMPGDATKDGRRKADARHDAEASTSDVRDAGHERDVRTGDVTVPDGGPYLVWLSVTAPADASADVTLVPPFAPTVYDYYVRCGPGANSLQVSLQASPGANSELTQPTKSPALPKQTINLDVNENQAIVAEAVEGPAAVPYWVRCLPSDFPTCSWNLHPDAGAPTPGYYMVGGMAFPPGVRGYAAVLDSNGVPVWYSYHGGPVYDVDTVVPGSISYSSPWQITQLSPSPPTTHYLSAFGMSPDIHDLRPYGGNYYVFYAPIQTGVDLTGLSIPLSDGGAENYGPDASILACDVLEIDSSGNVLWQWTATDHFDPAIDMTYKVPILAQPVVEPFHCNAIDVDPATGNLLVSARHMDSVFYIERATGRVLWKIGGSPFNKDGAIYVLPTSPFNRQHDARLLGWTETCSGGSGQISVFDDETDTPNRARGVVYDVTIGAASDAGPADGGLDCGAAAGDAALPADGGTATVAWQWQGKSASEVCGSFRVLSDGSHTIGWGETMPPMFGYIFTELDEAGNDLLDYQCSDGLASYRSIKVPLSAFDLDVLRNTAGM